MTRINRRQFLRSVLTGVGGLASSLLGGCLGRQRFGEKMLPSTKVKAPTRTTAATLEHVPTSSPTSPQPTGTSSPTPLPPAPDLAVTRHSHPQRLVKKAIRALGGMENFVRSGDDVIIKPNICVAYHDYRYAATTNPEVVATLVELALGYGARRVRVMDNPFGGTPQQAYRKSGIQEAVRKAGGKMEVMAPF